MSNEVPVVFHNDSNYDYHSIMKKLANKVEGKFECLGENTKNYKTLSVQIEKQVIKIDKDANESILNISSKIQFFDSARFMVTSLSNLVDNLTNRIHKTKCKNFCCFLEHKTV